MADIRIKDLPTTATQTASDDFIALDGTVNGTRKIDASAPSFKTSVTSPSIVAPAATALTLTGGSTGASLVLGQGTTVGDLTFTPTGSATAGTLVLSRRSASAATIATISYGADSSSLNQGPGYFFLGTNSAIPLVLGTTGLERARIPATGNLLIGTTTDATSLSGGLVINGSGAGAAASSTTTGALRVTGGVGVSGAGYFGGQLTANSGNLFTNTVTTNNNYLTIGTDTTARDAAYITKNGTADWYSGLLGSLASDSAWRLYHFQTSSTRLSVTTAGVVNIPNTTSASSSTVGALTIGNGTAATNVAIGGGKINVGSTEASTSSTTGAGIFAGGIYAGAASVFGSTISTTGSVGVGVTPKTWASVTGLEIGNASIGGSASEIYALSNAYYNAGWKYKSTGIAQMYSQDSGGHTFRTAASGSADGAITFTNSLVISTAGAATFAGAVTIAGTVIHTLSATPASASATGTVGTMSWDANYIYICTAANTWKRVAIATW